MKFKFFILFLFLIFSISVFATSHLPIGLLKIEEANNQLALNYLETFSIAIAFLAGIVSIFSPCILPLLPAFFSYTFKERTNITKMTLIFFLGFTISFIFLGIASVTIFKAAFSSLQNNFQLIIRIFGLAMIGLGIMTFIGKGFSGLLLNKKFKNDSLGTFFYGIMFAFGWSACIGPILSGILLMTSIFNNYFTAIYLMFFYSLGIFLPLFLLSIYFDKSQLLRKKILEKEIEIGNFKTHITKFISVILFIIVGLVFLIFGSTAIVNTSNLFGLRENFYNFQDYLVNGGILLNILGGILIIILVILIYYFGFRRKEDGKRE